MPSAQEPKTKGKLPRRSLAARSGDAIRVSAKDEESYAYPKGRVGELPHPRAYPGCPVLQVSSISFSDEEFEADLLYLKTYPEQWDLIKEKWMSTSAFCLHFLKDTNNATIFEYHSSYPCLGLAGCHLLGRNLVNF